MQGTFWVCPDCCGDFSNSPDPVRARCLICGKTLEQYAHRFPKEAIAHPSVESDERYVSVIDPMALPPLDPS